MAKRTKAERTALIARAREQYADPSDDSIEVDESARIADGDGGVWVQAWVWLGAEQ